jgi:glycerol dehydrogenase-like iron-containing ADH family enzyme
MSGNAFQVVATDDEVWAETKICNKCGLPKKLDEFRLEKRGISGRKATCKECIKPADIVKNRKKGVTNDMIREALENAAYRLLKERVG